MIQTKYLSIEEVIQLHKRTITKHGGADGIRDMGLLESSLLRCQSGYYESLSEQAASLMQSFCMNHCFVDGNKRVALLTTAVFLKMNGFKLACNNREVVDFIINDVIIKKSTIEEITSWLEEHIKEL